ncbi:MAG: SHOCT domain-containing protein [Burkholderiaceae bacterium]|nr:SHOCT domain-containing protein [Burkholderiaceae bacterium]
MELFLGWLILSSVVAYIASSRGRLALDYFLLSVLLSPLVGLIVLLTKSNLAEEAKKARIRREDQDRQIEALKSAQNIGPSVHAPGEGTSSSKLVADELEKLANLRDRGVLTEDEFQTRKSLLLG